jgi:hypothetical protein
MVLTLTAIRRDDPTTTIVLVDNASWLPVDLSSMGRDEATARWLKERVHVIHRNTSLFEIGAYRAGLHWLSNNSMLPKFDRFIFQQGQTIPTVPPLIWENDCHFARTIAHTALMTDRIGVELLWLDAA